MYKYDEERKVNILEVGKPKTKEQKTGLQLELQVYICTAISIFLVSIFAKVGFKLWSLTGATPLFYGLYMFKKNVIIEINPSLKGDEKGRTLFDIAVGKDLEKESIFYYDFRESHTLIGGVTRWGKSVLMNSLLYNLIKISPNRLRIIIGDFKGVDFVLFEDIPHLLTDEIISNPNDLKIILKWLVEESERRYKQIKELKVRNIKGYNQLSKTKMNYIFFILDEFLKMMSYYSPTEKKEVFELLNALISTSAGCGIILFLTTQRPDVQTVDARFKANLNNRIAFHCVDEGNSKIILDETGAETLRKKGEMLFKNDYGVKHLLGFMYSDKEILERVKDVSCKYPNTLRKINLNEQNIKNNVINFEPKIEIEANQIFKNEDTEKVILKSFENNLINLSRTRIRKLIGGGDKKADNILNELKEINFISNDEEQKILITFEEFRELKNKYILS